MTVTVDRPLAAPRDAQSEVRGEADRPSTTTRGWERGYLFNAILAMVAIVLLVLVADVALVGGLQERARQSSEFQRFRLQIAEGTAPLGGVDGQGHRLRPGTPVALLEIPRLHAKLVVDEGTSAAVLMSGPGHRSDTPLPGQAGASYIFGRAGAFGGPFSGIHSLKKGDVLRVTTQQGPSTFNVIDVRQKGDLQPPPLTDGQSRLTLETATGTAYLPDGVLLVDAGLKSPVLASTQTGIAAGTLPANQKPLGTTGVEMWALVLLLEVALLFAVGVVWSWHRWGKAQTLIVGVPLGIVVVHLVGQQVALTLPNLT